MILALLGSPLSLRPGFLKDCFGWGCIYGADRMRRSRHAVSVAGHHLFEGRPQLRRVGAANRSQAPLVGLLLGFGVVNRCIRLNDRFRRTGKRVVQLHSELLLKDEVVQTVEFPLALCELSPEFGNHFLVMAAGDQWELAFHSSLFLRVVTVRR